MDAFITAMGWTFLILIILGGIGAIITAVSALFDHDRKIETLIKDLRENYKRINNVETRLITKINELDTKNINRVNVVDGKWRKRLHNIETQLGIKPEEPKELEEEAGKLDNTRAV